MYFLKGILYVVGCPIGNFFDFSNRAIFILKKVDFIIAEDSRKIGFLISFFKFKNKILVLNVENETNVCSDLIKYIKNGFSAALVSDSGTPCVSDPGQFLINSAYSNNIKVVAIPGSSVVSTVVSICSFNVNRFIFEGFLPKKKIYKEIFLFKLIYECRTCIFFESGSRLLETLILFKSIFDSERLVFIAKDLTKKFEFIFYFKLSEFTVEFFESNNFLDKGEFVILLSSFDSNSLINKNNNCSFLFKLLNNDSFLLNIVLSSSFNVSNYLFF
ncbi:16S rRNA (cytidine(1402)-2'-O)-methyltransferase [Candidatus Azoamicus ciliaticola]|uniref:Ribosomal RNA small subunit methyltransferase I n=1 Tax=Candidatus Azoamicus ciliaticola TaxID=2652803 RepID=A0A6J5JYV6_9GAMM|nr:16S rRNA (cytidine(1402)-2'-O)-methyltransferase [Candidatus Azoamicus ciliaticola]CAB3976299.1 Ribosomal RNA small subunit methyltransferase I [Candidatus Azoamicus ciliaticola]